jgi:hypothetical protein
VTELDEFKKVLRYNSLTGEFFWLTFKGFILAPGQRAGHLQKSGYVAIGYEGKYYKAHRLAWLFTYGEWPLKDIDHINRRKDDNRIANLRECTSAQNQANRRANKNNSTGYRGVSFHRKIGKFHAAIRVNWKPIHLGYFSTAEEAGAAYDAAAITYYGEFGKKILDKTPEKVD